MTSGVPYMVGISCSIASCSEPARKRGWCDAHYARWRRWGDPEGGTTRRSGSLINRALGGLIPQESGCWEWQGLLNQGYGVFRVGRRVHRVHRVVYEAVYGPVPDGLVLDHLCRNRKCAFYDHLEAVTQRENMQRGWWATKDHCVHGHPYTPENLRITARGSRECRACRQEVQARRRLGPPPLVCCEECGREFQPARRSAKLCSKPCRWQAWSKRRRAA